MEISGTIKKIDETKTFGSNGFRKREIVITTNENYPQMLLVEFVQDKCDILNNFEVGQEVKVSINLRGREWINPKGEAVYFNSIQGWRVELLEHDATGDGPPPMAPLDSLETITDLEDNEPDDLPF